MSSRHPVPHTVFEPVPEPAPPPPRPAYGGLPCVWMSAGLVAYKLCDRGFECESCPFDQAMRGALPPPPRPPEGDGARPRGARRGRPFRPFRVGRGAAPIPTIDGGSGTRRAVSQDHGVHDLQRSVH